MNLYLIRHGDSAVPRGYVQNNFPLSDLGRKQARALAKRMKSIKIDILFSSPLIRALESAEFISKTNSIPVQVEQDFREMDLGHMAGMSKRDVSLQYGNYLMSHSFPQMEYGYVGGETAKQLQSRVANAFDKLIWIPLHREEVNVLLVAHGGVICAILLHLLGLVFDGYLIFFADPTGISKIDARHGRPRILYFNDTSHLKKVTNEP